MGARVPWRGEDRRKLLYLIKQRATLRECEKAFPSRSRNAVAVERAILKKHCWIWGLDHSRERRRLLKAWIDAYEPKKVFEGFAGKGDSTYLYAQKAESVVAAELNKALFQKAKRKLHNCRNVRLLNKCAEEALLAFSVKGVEFDWIDLDPFGSVGSLIPLATRSVRHGHVCFTLTELHMFRFRRKQAAMCKYLLPTDIFELPSVSQIGYLLGSIVFDSTRYTFWRGRRKVASPKLVTPIEVRGFGGLEIRVVRVLLRIELASSVAALHKHLFQDLQILAGRERLPYIDVRRFLAANETS